MSSTVLTLPSWKQEPLSPPSEESTWVSLSEEDFFHSPLEQDIDLKLETYDFSLNGESKANIASQLLEDLEKLVDLDELIKEEPFYLDVKMLPALDEMEQSRYPIKIELPTTDQIIFDSASMCNIIEYGPTATTLTPPQSPPSVQPMLTTLKPLVASEPSLFQVFQNGQEAKPMVQSERSLFQVFQNEQEAKSMEQPERPLFQVYQESSLIVPEKQLLDNVLVYRQVDYPAVVTPQPDIAHELAVVDELVRSHVENMQWSGPSSPCNSNTSSNSSFEDSCSSSDPEWVPEAIENINETQENVKTSQRKRSKPYSRNAEDKKSRKKEQNKSAATRYRLKKKAEVEEILSEEKELIQEGDKFKNQITDIQREIKYLKGLMRDLFKAKGLIN